MAKVVQGEETNTFSNAIGESIVVGICPTSEETTQLLAKVMGSDIATAELLATEVHKDIQFLDIPMIATLPIDFDADINDLGIWIDPIGKKCNTVIWMFLNNNYNIYTCRYNIILIYCYVY